MKVVYNHVDQLLGELSIEHREEQISYVDEVIVSSDLYCYTKEARLNDRRICKWKKLTLPV